MKEMSPIAAWLRQPYDLFQLARADRKLAAYDEAQTLWLASRTTPARVAGLIVGGSIEESVTALAARKAVMIERLCSQAVLNARAEIGHGELPGKNNRGPDIVRYCAPHGDGWEWCAGFYGYLYFEAARILKVPMPFKRSLGAKRLADNIAEVGRRFDDPAEALPGDALVFDRGITGSHKGHIEILEHTDPLGLAMRTIPGNTMPLVCERKRNILDKGLRFREFVSLRPVAP